MTVRFITASACALTLAVSCSPTAIGASVSTLHHRAHSQRLSLRRWIGAERFFANHPVQARSKIGRHELRRAHVWVAVIKRELAETVAALRPRATVGHLEGWLCIHKQEGAWNDEGGPYYGGLQMTWGWAGRVTDAARLSPGQQIAAAEAEASEHGWSWSWMHGQWPNTYPPCARYFA